MSIDLTKLTHALQVGDQEELQAVLGYSPETGKPELMERIGELERLNDGLRKTVKWQNERNEAYVKILTRIVEYEDWSTTKITKTMKQYGDLPKG